RGPGSERVRYAEARRSRGACSSGPPRACCSRRIRASRDLGGSRALLPSLITFHASLSRITSVHVGFGGLPVGSSTETLFTRQRVASGSPLGALTPRRVERQCSGERRAVRAFLEVTGRGCKSLAGPPL